MLRKSCEPVKSLNPKLSFSIPSLYSASIAIANMGSTLKIISLGGGTELVGLSYLLYNLGFTISSWTLPYAFRGSSRKVVLCACLFTLSLIFLSIALANSAIMVVLLQLPYGFVASFTSSVQTSIFVELVRCKHRGVYTMYLFSGLGFAMGGLLGGILRRFFELSTVILLASAFTGLSASIALASLPSTLGVIEASTVVAEKGMLAIVVEKARLLYTLFVRPRGGFPKALKHTISRTIPLFLLASGTVFVAIMMFFSAFPVYLRKVAKVPESLMMALPAVSGATSTSIYALISRLEVHYSKLWRIHVIALAARALLFSSPIFIGCALGNPFVTITFYFFIGLTWAFIGSVQSNVMVHLAEPSRREERLGHLNAAISIGSIIGSTLASSLSSLGYYTIFILSAITISISALLNALALRTLAK